MTCIAAIADGGQVFMGADTAASYEDDTRSVSRADEKIFWKGPLLIGFCGSFRMAQVIRYCFTPPPLPKKSGDITGYLAGKFSQALRKALESAGLLASGEVVELPGNLLIGYKGQIYEIDSDLGVGTYRDPFVSIGTGAVYAQGSLYSTAGQAPQDRLRIALEAAERFDAGVRSPFSFADTTAAGGNGKADEV